MEYHLPSGSIVLAATPIGDTRDASARLISALREADIIAAEDTRRLKALLQRLGLETSARLISFHDHNEGDRSGYLIELAQAGNRILVVSDAGMPTVSDPGFRLVVTAIDADVPLTVLPGPSASVTALALSGLPSDRFTFEGFLPRKAGDARRYLKGLSRLPHTLIFFESPRRLNAALSLMVEVFGPDRRAVVCRELTKTYEETIRGTLSDLVEKTKGEVLGEISIVVEGHRGQVDASDYVEEVQALVADGMRLKEAVAQVAKDRGCRKNELYQAALATSE